MIDEIIVQELMIMFLKSDVGCPICKIINDCEFDLLTKLQLDVSKNEIIRKQIARQRGFCDFHFRQFKKIANGKTNIKLLKTIIEEFDLKSQLIGPDCIICLELDKYEADVLDVLINLIADEKFKGGYQKSTGICFDHLNKTSPIIHNEETKAWLYQTYLMQIKNLQNDFDEMDKKKSFYEIDRQKRKLINVLAEKLTGRKSRSL